MKFARRKYWIHHLINEIHLIFKSVPYNSIINAILDGYDGNQSDVTDENCKVNNKLIEYASEISLPSLYCYNKGNSEKIHIGHLIRDIRDCANARVGHFFTIMAIIISLLALIISMIAIFIS